MVRKIVALNLLAVAVVLALSGAAGATLTPAYRDPLPPLFPDDPWGRYNDECWWDPTAPGCQEEEPCGYYSCAQTCYTCMSIPEGPNGEPGGYHCASNDSGGFTFCVEAATGCDVSGSCGSWN